MRPWPIDVAALGPVTAGAIVWRQGGRLALTIVAKATFALVHAGRARLAEPVELADGDRHHDGSPWQSLAAADDLAPFLPDVGVTLVGSACAPANRAVPAMSARLAISGPGAPAPVLDKTIHVFGDRVASAPGQPAPFVRMPLVYERAFGGAGFADNPLGVGVGPGAAPDATRLPNLVDPIDPRKPACFGPIPRAWTARREALGPAAWRALEARVPELGDDFPWAALHAAPLDQRIAALAPDAWIVLDGMHPALVRVQTQLPGARALARVVGRGGVTSLALIADTLIVDADRQEASVVFRAVTHVASEAELGALRAFVGLDLPGAPLAWPVEASAHPVEDSSTIADPTTPDTVVDDAVRAALPFAGSAAAPPRAPANVSATPFAPPPEPPAGRGNVPGTPFAATAPAPADARPPTLTGTPFVAAPGARPPTDPPAPPGAALPFAQTRSPSTPPPPAFVPAAPERPSPFAASTRAAESEAAERASTPASRFFHASARGVAEPAAPPPREPPPRTGEVAPIVDDATSFTAALVAWQIRPPTDSMTVVVKGSFALVPDAPAAALEESDFPIGDLHVDDDPTKSLAYASDLAPLKPMADVVATGHAYAPGKRAPAMQVTLKFGAGKRGFSRTLNVYGDRRWRSTVVTTAPSDPEAFESMPITWERAFGGPSFDKNPCGVGHKAAAGADGIARLPNVELTSPRIVSPGDAPAPAGFGPIAPTWKERWSKLGTYDRAWFKQRWPYFPADFDWTHFQTAPAPQQLPYLAGDESFEIVGMFADRPSLRGELPGVRARAFVQKTKEAGGGFVEVPTVLDTAIFDLDAMRVHLVWRGHIEVSDDDAPEVQQVFVTREDLRGAPRSLEEHKERFLARAIKKPKEPDAPAPPARPAAAPAPVADPAAAKVDADVAQREAALASTIDPGPPPPPPDPEKIADAMRARGASEEDIVAVLGIFKPAMRPPLDPGESTRDKAIRLLAAGGPLDGVDLVDADLSDLDFSGRSMVRAKLTRARACGARFVGAVLAGASLAEADLAFAAFDEADLTRADLHAAHVDDARFLKAKLLGADLSGVSGERASFTGASATKAIFERAHLPRASFEEADLTSAILDGANLDGAAFGGAKLVATRFYDASALSAVFDAAAMTGVRADGARFAKASFRGVDAKSASLGRATLDEANFTGANLAGAVLLRAKCAKTSFAGADLRGARLTRANLQGASLVKANLMDATLERANLTRADLRYANLHAAGLWKAKIKDAKLDQAILTKSTLSPKVST